MLEPDLAEIERGVPASWFVKYCLPQYLCRIGLLEEKQPICKMDLTPTLDFLNRIIHAHHCSIPFENTEVFLAGGVSLKVEDIFRKLVSQHRGGYCFEHNRLLAQILQVLGYVVEPKEARVFLDDGITLRKQYCPTRNHILLLVTIPQSTVSSQVKAQELYVVDVGFGPASPRIALRLVCGKPQAQGDADFELRKCQVGGPLRPCQEIELWCLESAVGATHPIRFYRFNPDSHYSWVDAAITHMSVYSHPQSVFANILWVASESEDGVRHNLMGPTYTQTFPRSTGDNSDAPKQILEITSSEQLRELLHVRFGLKHLTKTHCLLLYQVSKGNASLTFGRSPVRAPIQENKVNHCNEKSITSVVKVDKILSIGVPVVLCSFFAYYFLRKHSASF